MCTFVTSPQAVRLLCEREINAYVHVHAGFISGFRSRGGTHIHIHVAANFKGEAKYKSKGEGAKASPGPPEINPVMHVHVGYLVYTIPIMNVCKQLYC